MRLISPLNMLVIIRMKTALINIVVFTSSVKLVSLVLWEVHARSVNEGRLLRL